MEKTPEPAPWDKLLPNQNSNSALYRSDTKDLNRRIYETIVATCGLKESGEEFQLRHTPLYTPEQMGYCPVRSHILLFLLRLCRAKNVLEIGTFIGVSAMAFAKAVGPNGKVVTIEKFEHFAEIAEANFAGNGLDDRITLVHGDAINVLKDFDADARFDFMFVDGNKERYSDYLDILWPRLNDGGMIAFDDSFFSGDVLNDRAVTEKGKGAEKLIRHAGSVDGCAKMFLPVANGLLVLGKGF